MTTPATDDGSVQTSPSSSSGSKRKASTAPEGSPSKKPGMMGKFVGGVKSAFGAGKAVHDSTSSVGASETFPNDLYEAHGKDDHYVVDKAVYQTVDWAYHPETTVCPKRKRRVVEQDPEKVNCDLKLEKKPTNKRWVLQDVEDEANPKDIGVWCERREVARQAFRPGDVIWAIHAFANDDPQILYPDDMVRIFQNGSVFAKHRPMIVLWRTEQGVIGAPIFTLPWLPAAKGKDEVGARGKELMSITTSKNTDWVGNTPENGNPLIMNISKSSTVNFQGQSYVDIARPCYISRHEPVLYSQARLTRESYVRLMEAIEFRELVQKRQILKEWDLDWFSWPPLAPKDQRWEMSAATKNQWTKRYVKGMGLSETEFKAGIREIPNKA